MNVILNLLHPQAPHAHRAWAHWELVENWGEHGVIHLFNFINPNGEILTPLIDVIHQAKGQILKHIQMQRYYTDL